jgi:hypothetical protein
MLESGNDKRYADTFVSFQQQLLFVIMHIPCNIDKQATVHMIINTLANVILLCFDRFRPTSGAPQWRLKHLMNHQLAKYNCLGDVLLGSRTSRRQQV